MYGRVTNEGFFMGNLAKGRPKYVTIVEECIQTSRRNFPLYNIEGGSFKEMDEIIASYCTDTWTDDYDEKFSHLFGDYVIIFPKMENIKTLAGHLCSFEFNIYIYIIILVD